VVQVAVAQGMELLEQLIEVVVVVEVFYLQVQFIQVAAMVAQELLLFPYQPQTIAAQLQAHQLLQHLEQTQSCNLLLQEATQHDIYY
jgi:hypothetical protein